MNLDLDTLAHNTAEARAALVNAPGWTKHLTTKTFPRRLPDARGFGVAVFGLALFGSVGAGKTGFGACILRDLAAAGFGSWFYWNLVTGVGVAEAVEAGILPRLPSPCWYESWPRLLAARRREKWDEEGWFEQLEERVSALMLDDVGVDAGTPFRESILLRHVEWAAERSGRILILTLNDRPPEWTRVLGDRVADRLLDATRFAVVELAGASLR